MKHLFATWKFAVFFFGFFIGLFSFVSLSNLQLNLHKSIMLYTQNEELFYQEFLDDSGYHSFVSISEIPEHVKNAFVLLEDKRFYTHSGIDILAIARSSYLNFIYFRKGKKLFWEELQLGSYCVEVFEDKEKQKRIASIKNTFFTF